MITPVELLSVATSVPPYVVTQAQAAEAARQWFADRFVDFTHVSRVFQTSGIHRRYTVRPLDWYFAPLDWPERNGAYLEAACSLFTDVSTKALDKAGVRAADIDAVITVSSTGIATPTLEARAADKLGLRPDIARVPLFGLGCAGGVAGLATAMDLARAVRGRTVLLVSLELCSLSFRLDTLTKENIVATALFGDGASACVLRSGEAGAINVDSAGQILWPRTLDIMGWRVDREGLGVIFDRAIPPFAAANVGAAMAAILEKEGVAMEEIDRFVCPPGGAKVITALEKALSLAQGSLNLERSVLADYGNMSAPTALFVLERAIDASLPKRTVVMAMGPGFSMNAVSLGAAA